MEIHQQQLLNLVKNIFVDTVYSLRNLYFLRCISNQKLLYNDIIRVTYSLSRCQFLTRGLADGKPINSFG